MMAANAKANVITANRRCRKMTASRSRSVGDGVRIGFGTNLSSSDMWSFTAPGLLVGSSDEAGPGPLVLLELSWVGVQAEVGSRQERPDLRNQILRYENQVAGPEAHVFLQLA